MNAIFGVIHLDGAPATETLQTMHEGLDSIISGKTGLWERDWAGLGCLHLPGTPEALGEQLPLYDAEHELVITAGVRLDNRDELLDELKMEGQRSVITDAQLILHAYHRWGENCVLHLDGDWHFALWDLRRRRLFLARDQQGNTGLYYFHGPRSFLFASSKKGLLALDAVPKQPDLLRVAQVLSAWAGDGKRTGYADIQRLPPAHRMVITHGQARMERYWFPEHISALHLKSDEEYLEAFLCAFYRAVGVRLRGLGTVGVTLSGGMDSGAVTAIAAEQLRERGQSLLAFTAGPLSNPDSYTDQRRIGDEIFLAQQTARHAGNVEHHILRTETITPMGGIERMLWVHDDPGHAAGNQYWLTALLEAARERQVGTLLTGQMGNAIISWTGCGENLLPMLWQGAQTNLFRSSREFWHVFEKTRAGAGLDRWRAARRFLFKPLLYPYIARVRRRWRLGQGAWQSYSALQPGFGRAVGLEDAMVQDGFLPGFVDPDPFRHRLDIIQPGRSILGASWFEKGLTYGLEVRDPTQDRQLIELCLAIPESQFQRDGVDRWLIRRAMHGRLPDSVRLNARRGLQAADLGERVLASRDEIIAGLARLKQHPLARKALNLERMESVLAALEHGLTPQNSAECGTILLRGLMAGFFLLRFPD